MYQYTHKDIVRFSDSDAAGLLHFSRLLCYVEVAEHAALAELGAPVNLRAENALHWPRVSLNAAYLAPVFPQQEISVQLTLERAGRSSLSWAWEVLGGGEVLARGSLKTVCCRSEEGRLVPVELPDSIKSAR